MSFPNHFRHNLPQAEIFKDEFGSLKNSGNANINEFSKNLKPINLKNELVRMYAAIECRNVWLFVGIASFGFIYFGDHW